MKAEAAAVVEKLRKKRAGWVQSTRDNNFEAGIRRQLADIYPDQAHFIFELLQNAEDAGATAVEFKLLNRKLIVTHDGRQFSANDVTNITGIGNTQKTDEPNAIGKFGIGFKSVFSYTSAPVIYSGEFGFRIEDLVCPHPEAQPADLGDHTRFVLPFDNPGRSPRLCFREIEKELEGLPDETLLFLRNVEEIRWKIGGKKPRTLQRELAGSGPRLSLLHTVGRRERRTHWLRFERPLPGQEELSVAVAFGLNVGKETRVAKVKGKLCIFFPAAKEQTGLKFHVHGPFASTVARDAIPDNNAENARLLELAAELAADSLDELKAEGLLDNVALRALPNADDDIPPVFEPFRTQIHEAMRSRPLVPRESGGHAPAEDLRTGPARLRRVLGDEGLAHLEDHEELAWACAAKADGRAKRLMDALEIEEWSDYEFLAAVVKRFGQSADTVGQSLGWLNGQFPGPRLQEFFICLSESLGPFRWQFKPELERCYLVPLEKEPCHFGKPCYVFLPPPTPEELSKDASVVRADLLAAKPPRRARIVEALEALGVREFDEKAAIETMLDRYYPKHGGEGELPSDSEHLLHMGQLIDFVARHPHTRVLEGRAFLKTDEGRWVQPSHACMPEGFDDGGMRALSQALSEIEPPTVWPGDPAGSLKKLEVPPATLTRSYRQLGPKRFPEFAERVGVMTRLRPAPMQVGPANPLQDVLKQDWYLPGRRRTHTEISEDWIVLGLDTMLAAEDPRVSRALWLSLPSWATKTRTARYRPNQEYPIRRAPSVLVDRLTNKAWLPLRNGQFVRPCDATEATLSEELPLDGQDEGWLRELRFAEKEKQADEKVRERRRMATELGMPPDVLDMMEGLDQEGQAAAWEEFRTRIQTRRASQAERDRAETGYDPGTFPESFGKAFDRPGLPSRESPAPAGGVRDPAARRQAERKRSANAIDDEPPSRHRFRVVPRKTWERRDNTVRTFLEAEYGGRCQVCDFVFTQAKGRPYFEGLHIVASKNARWTDDKGNTLCLCPNHAAQLQHGPVHAEGVLDWFRSYRAEAEGGLTPPELPLELCGKPVLLRFTEKHLLAIQGLLQASEGESDEVAG